MIMGKRNDMKAMNIYSETKMTINTYVMLGHIFKVLLGSDYVEKLLPQQVAKNEDTMLLG